MQNIFSKLVQGESEIIATAIHDGHDVRDDVQNQYIISSEERLREEDPYTGRWTDIAATSVIAKNSRFQVDLNRPREKAVYITPDDCWGLHVWKTKPTEETVEKSLAEYDLFYNTMHTVISKLVEKHKHIVILDLHTYNHMRDGADGPPADPKGNPEINVGTGIDNRPKWRNLVDRYIKDFHDFDFMGRHLDVRENIKFKGGHFSRWCHQNFPESCCVLSVEVKKIFMDEWTGKLNKPVFDEVHKVLHATTEGILEELQKLK